MTKADALNILRTTCVAQELDSGSGMAGWRLGFMKFSATIRSWDSCFAVHSG
jgi:hypothetical protein